MNETRREAIRQIMNVIHTDGMVVAGKLPTERRLAELTGLGRLSLREALIAMEGMGILEIRNRQGIYVNESRGEELSYLMEIVPVGPPSEVLGKAMELRLIVDPAAAAIAAARRKQSDVEKLEECMVKMRETRLCGGDKEPERGAYWNSVLHSEIFHATDNILLVRVHDSLKSIIEKGVTSMRIRMPQTRPGWRDLILAQHGEIVRAIAEKDVPHARESMARHIRHTIENMKYLGQLSRDFDPTGTPPEEKSSSAQETHAGA